MKALRSKLCISVATGRIRIFMPLPLRNGMKEKMNSMFFCINRNILLISILLLLPSVLRAQTAGDAAKEIEEMYRKGAATSISFMIDGEKTSLSFATESSKFRIENPSDLIVSDGETIWHYGKKKKEVVIDKIAS